ncbi:hypothetical protein JOL79_16560 [Microbispora sp. RL4-1S]|uniref:Uncharacterized protein n=1 Tax=Microbispora oryzae TaxID=2806554 RepID=A0A940WLA4_9ACTN|nr:hypothetical protein [Microbispora oryzae]MBP2705427.1 hypothetical protein [Microbispora oryzae]
MSWINDSFWQQLTVGLAGGLLGVAGTLLAAQVSSRGKSKSELSYTLEVQRALPEVSKELTPSVAVSYKGQLVPALYAISCTVENTGNTLVRDQEIRIQLSPAPSILDRYLDPKPQPEWAVDALPDTEETTRPGYRFGHLAPGRKVTFKIICAASQEPKALLRDHNPTEVVTVLPRAVTAQADIRGRTRIALMLLLALLIAPQAFYALGSFGDLAASVVRIGLIAALIPVAPSLVRTLVNLLFRPEPRVELESGLIMYSSEITGGVYITGAPSDRQVPTRSAAREEDRDE